MRIFMKNVFIKYNYLKRLLLTDQINVKLCKKDYNI